MMVWSWEVLVVELTIFATMALSVLWLERYEWSLSRLTEESVKRLRPDQISALSEGAERFRVIVKVLKPLSLATLTALLLLTLIKPTDWIRNLGISLAIMYSYVALRRLARLMEARHVRVQSIISRLSTG